MLGGLLPSLKPPHWENTEVLKTMYHHNKSDSRNDLACICADNHPAADSSAGSGGVIPQPSLSEKPPLTNRGALITPPLVNRFLIDWAAFTFKLNDPQEVINIIGLNQSIFTEIDRGMHGYRKSLRFGNIGVFFDGQENMGCHVNLSGEGCRQYEAQFEENPWLQLLTSALANSAKFTRLDIAQDNVEGELDLAKLKDAIDNKQLRTRFKKAGDNNSYNLSAEERVTGNGRTIYFGKRSSRVYIRFYDKAAQLGFPLRWNRAEIELKDERAQMAAQILESGVWIGKLFVGILNQYLAVINLDDPNKSRCTLQEWWHNWLQSTDKIRLTTAKAVKTVEESMEYFIKQHAPNFAMFRTYLGAARFKDFMEEVLINGKARISMKHEKMMFLSTQLKADNYNHDDEFEERAAIMEYDGGMEKREAELTARQLLDKDKQS